MTIEEKAKRYDEAIKKINDYYEGKTKLYSDVDKTLDYLFPELKESEDERIRKALMCFLEDLSKLGKNTNFDRWSKSDCAEWITWLEKQGEQKPAWSEEDETIKNNISHIIRQYDKISKRENQPCWYIGDCLLWMQNIKGRVLPQPKQEWSEEDEKIYQSIMDDTIQENQLDGKQIDWLRNIKYRNFARPQNTWKPSDEQMKGIECTIKTLKYQLNCGDNRLDSLYNDLKKLKG